MVAEVDKSRFKNPSGAFYLRGIFFEETGVDKSSVVYTLKEADHLGYPSLYRLYMEANDPTEYNFAVSHLYSWSHWEALSQCTWFRPYLDAWRRELETKIRAESLVQIRATAKEATPTGFQANKYLLESPWKAVGEFKRGRGRPTKADIQKAASDLARASQEHTEDFTRVFGKTN